MRGRIPPRSDRSTTERVNGFRIDAMLWGWMERTFRLVICQDSIIHWVMGENQLKTNVSLWIFSSIPNQALLPRSHAALRVAGYLLAETGKPDGDFREIDPIPIVWLPVFGEDAVVRRRVV